MRFQDIFNGNIYLYARVSTDRQVTDRQIEGGLKWFADRGVPKEDVIVFQEKISSSISTMAPFERTGNQRLGSSRLQTCWVKQRKKRFYLC